MCGIIGVIVSPKGALNNNKTFNKIRGIFENQQSRGVDGAGFVVSRGDKGWYNTVGKRYRTTEALSLFRNRKQISKELKENAKLIFHHRFPTSNLNVERNNHPIFNEKKTLALVHNGIVSNASTLIKELRKSKHVFETGTLDTTDEPNDSETIVHLIEEGLKGSHKTDEAIVKAINHVNGKATGTITIAFILKGKTGVYLWVRGNPLIIYKDKLNNLYFSSEMPVNQGYKIVQRIGQNDIYKLTSTKAKKIGETLPSEIPVYVYQTENYNLSTENALRKQYGSTYFDKEDDEYLYVDGEGWISLDKLNEERKLQQNKDLDLENWINPQTKLFINYEEKGDLSGIEEKIFGLTNYYQSLDFTKDDSIALTQDLVTFVDELLASAMSRIEGKEKAMNTIIARIQILESEKKDLRNKGYASEGMVTYTKIQLNKILMLRNTTLKNKGINDLLHTWEQFFPDEKDKDEIVYDEEEEGDYMRTEEEEQERNLQMLEEDNEKAEMREQHNQFNDYTGLRELFE